MATFVSENFDALTPPALPAGWTTGNTVVSTAAAALSAPNSMSVAAAGAYAVAIPPVHSTGGGDCRVELTWQFTGTPSAAVAPTIWCRSGLGLAGGYRVALFVTSFKSAIELNGTAITLTNAGSLHSSFTTGAWYRFIVDAVTRSDRLGVWLLIWVQRVSDGAWLVQTASAFTWQAAQYQTPLCGFDQDQIGYPDDGYVAFGGYCSSGAANGLYIDNVKAQDYIDVAPAAPSVAAPSDEVEWLYSGNGAVISSGAAAGTNAAVHDGDFTTFFGSTTSLTTVPAEGWIGIDLGSGQTAILSRVLFAGRLGNSDNGATVTVWDQYCTLNTIEGATAASTGPWAAVGQVPFTYYFGYSLNAIPVDYTPANAYRYFRLRNPASGSQVAELYFLGNRASGVSWRPVRPTITPGAGRFAAGKLVTITTLTAGASIYYTSDGTTPTNGSTLYAGPISLPTITSGASLTIKAIAYHASGTATSSAVTTAVFNPKEFVPDTKVLGPGGFTTWPQWWYDDGGRRIEAHYGGIRYDTATSQYLWVGSAYSQGGCLYLMAPITVYASPDLYNWTLLTILPPFPPSWRAGGANGFTQLFRPHIFVNQSPINPNNKYIIFGVPDYEAGYHTGALGCATAPAPAGPWTWNRYAIPNFGGSPVNVLDQSPFLDPTSGKLYIVFVGTYAVEMDATTDYTTFAGDAVLLKSTSTREGTAMFYNHGYYYILNTGNVPFGQGNSDVSYYSATSLAGIAAATKTTAWLKPPPLATVAHNAQTSNVFSIHGRTDLVLQLDLVDDGESPFNLYNMAYALFPIPQSYFPSPGVLTVPAPPIWSVGVPFIIDWVVFVGTDTTTQGTWIGTYGSIGYYKLEGAGTTLVSSLPSGVTFTINTSVNTFCFESNSSNVADLQRVDGSTRDSDVWYWGGAATMTIAQGDGISRRWHFYFHDDNSGRMEPITVSDPDGTTLDSRTASGFGAGIWYTWDVLGTVTFTITGSAGPNAILSGVLIDPTPVPTATPTASGSALLFQI